MWLVLAVATLDDIARRTGVSTATVSNVLRGRGSVGTKTAERVRATAKLLGYRPNLAARALAEGRAPTIALFFTNILNPFYPQFALEAERAARRRDHFLLVCNAATPTGELDTAYLDAVAGTLSEGLIVLGSDTGRRSLVAMLPPGVPAVLSTWEEVDAYPTVPCVTVDFRAAGRLAAEHLVGLGHRQIALLTGAEGDAISHRARYAGACDLLAEHGIALPRSRLQIVEDSITGGHGGAMRLLDTDPSLTAILATNDLLAIGALQAASERHLAVPDALSVIGITDIWMAAQVRPALTTIDISTASLAEGSVNLLLDLIEDPEQVPDAALRVVGSPSLVRRASTGPPHP